MGYNTGLLLLNDAIDGVWKDPVRFAEHFRNAFSTYGRSNDSMDFPIGNHANGGRVFHMAHADVTGVYAIGGNHTSRLCSVHNGGRHYHEAEQIQLLRDIADNLGYRISLTPKKK